MFCFYFIRLEMKNALLSGFPPIHQNKLQEEGVRYTIGIDNMKFEP